MPAKNGNTAASGKSTRGSINALLDLEFATARGKAHLHAAANHVDDLAELERLRGLQKTIKEGIRKGMMERMGIPADGGDDELAGLVDDTAADAPKLDLKALEAETRKDSQWQEYEAKCELVSKNILRFGGSIHVALGAFCNRVITRIVECTLTATVRSGKGSVTTAHLVEGCQGTDVEPFIKNLPAIQNYTSEGETEILRQWTAYNSALAEHKRVEKLRKKAEEEGKLDDADTPAAVERPTPPVEHHAPGTPNTNFMNYVNGSIKRVRAAAAEEAEGDGPYKTLRISQRVRQVISTLIIQLIRRLGECSRLTVFDLKGVRTLNTETFKLEVRKLHMVTCGADSPGVGPYMDYITSKVKVFTDYTAADRARKAADKKAKYEALGAEARAAIEADKKEAERKKKLARARRLKEQQDKRKAELAALVAEIKGGD